MGFLDWFRRTTGTRVDTGLSPPEHYPIDEKKVLLHAARRIKAAQLTHEEVMLAPMELAGAVIVLRRRYGIEAVENNCPAEQILAGYSSSDLAAKKEAGRILDELLRDLRACYGDEMRTWMRMAWMLNPRTLEAVWREREEADQARR